MNFNKGDCMRGKKSKAKADNNIDNALHAFMKTDVQNGKFGRYFIDGDNLVFRMSHKRNIEVTLLNHKTFIEAIENGEIACPSHSLNALKNPVQRYSNCQVIYLQEYKLAKRIRQDNRILYVGNAITLGRDVDYGFVNKIEQLMPMIRFSFFDSDGTDLKEQIRGWKHINEQKPGYMQATYD